MATYQQPGQDWTAVLRRQPVSVVDSQPEGNRPEAWLIRFGGAVLGLPGDEGDGSRA